MRNRPLAAIIQTAGLFLTVFHVNQVIWADSSNSNPDSTEYLKVAKGQLTFDLEGKDDSTLIVHWPGGSSGVTIGRGYDMKGRSRDQVIRDLVDAGLDKGKVEAFAKGARLEGKDANDFVQGNKALLGPITRLQQKRLFENAYADAIEDAKKGVNDAPKWFIRLPNGEMRTYERIRAFDQLPPLIQDVAADLAYNLGGDQFMKQGWGSIFQMRSFKDMGDYMAGKLSGEVLDSKGSPDGEASQKLAKWRGQVGKQRLAALIANLNKAAEGASTGPSSPTSQSASAPGAGHGKESKEVGYGDAIAMRNYDGPGKTLLEIRFHRAWEKPSPNVPLEGAAFRAAHQDEKWYIILAEIRNSGESDLLLGCMPILKIESNSKAAYLGSCQQVDGPASLKPVSPSFRVPRRGSIWLAYIFNVPRGVTPVTLVEAEVGEGPKQCDLFHLNLRKADGPPGGPQPKPAASRPNPEPPRRLPASAPSSAR